MSNDEELRAKLAKVEALFREAAGRACGPVAPVGQGTPRAASLRVAQGATRSRAGPPY